MALRRAACRLLASTRTNSTPVAWLGQSGLPFRDPLEQSHALDSRPQIPPLHRSFASSSRLFVGGLSWELDAATIKDAFSSFGEVVDVRVITDQATGRSRGFCFVSFRQEADARAAAESLNGQALGGRTLRIDFAVPNQRRREAGAGGGAGGPPGADAGP